MLLIAFLLIIVAIIKLVIVGKVSNSDIKDIARTITIIDEKENFVRVILSLICFDGLIELLSSLFILCTVL